MIDKLYHDTALENWFSINIILLDKGRFPKLFGWRAACDAYIAHIRECKRNIIQFDLDKALARLNIVEGLIIAAASIDEVVAIIRSSNDPTEASQKLIARFGFNEEQTKAILAMKLAALTKIDAIKLNDEREELRRKLETLRYLLDTPAALDEELIKILQEVANKFGDDRRTKITNVEEVDESVEPQKEEEISIMLFNNNMLRVVKKEELQGGKRGNRGVNIKPPKGATLINTLYSTNFGSIIAFTDKARMYNLSNSELEYGKDYSIYELLSLQDNENVILIIEATSFNSYQNLVTISKNGYIKKTAIKEYASRARKGIAAAKLDEGDSLVGAYLSLSDTDRIFIINSSGYYNFYSLEELSATGRVTKGVKAIRLVNDEFIQSATIIKDNLSYKGILTIDSTGTGKITPIDDFSMTARAAKGSLVMNLKDEKIAAIYAVLEDQSTIYVTANNKAVILDVASIPIQNRRTSGVRIIDARNLENVNIKIM